MATKLARVFQQLFGTSGSSAHFGQFGSRAAGFPILSKDPATIQALAAFIQNGWSDAINGANKAPFLEDMNGLHFLIFYQLCQMLQDGVPAWDPSTPYFIGSIVKRDGSTETFGSLTNSNIGNALPGVGLSNAFWQNLSPPAAAPIQTLFFSANTETELTSSSPTPTVIVGSITPGAGRRVRVTVSGTIITFGNSQAYAYLYRNGSQIYQGTNAAVEIEPDPGDTASFPFCIDFVDSPPTGSPVTYQIYGAVLGSLAFINDPWTLTLAECI